MARALTENVPSLYLKLSDDVESVRMQLHGHAYNQRLCTLLANNILFLAIKVIYIHHKAL